MFDVHPKSINKLITCTLKQKGLIITFTFSVIRQQFLMCFRKIKKAFLFTEKGNCTFPILACFYKWLLEEEKKKKFTLIHFHWKLDETHKMYTRYRVSHSKVSKVILLWWGHRFWFWFWFLLIFWILHVHEIGAFMPNLSVFNFFDVARPL